LRRKEWVYFVAEDLAVVALLTDPCAVVAGAKAERDDWAIKDEGPKLVRIRASKSIFKVGREFIVLFISIVIAPKSEIF